MTACIKGTYKKVEKRLATADVWKRHLQVLIAPIGSNMEAKTRINGELRMKKKDAPPQAIDKRANIVGHREKDT